MDFAKMLRPGNFLLELTSKLTEVIPTIPSLELEPPEATLLAARLTLREPKGTSALGLEVKCSIRHTGELAARREESEEVHF